MSENSPLPANGPSKDDASLFEPAAIRGMALRNRFVRSATWEGLARADGSGTPELERLYAGLARDDVGLVITGHAFVDPAGGLGDRQLGAHDDALLPSLAGMAAAVHAAGGKVALQISHAGLVSNRPAELGGPGAAPGRGPYGPSAPPEGSGLQGSEMTPADIAAIPPAFARAAARARTAGFDAVQIHSAHGYLLSEFLSPFFNRRGDRYGGDAVSRARLVAEVVAAVREAVGPDYPVLIKLNSDDFLPGGATTGDLLVTAVAVRQAGIDAIEISGGTSLSGDYRSVRTGAALAGARGAYYREAALALKPNLGVPLIMVGGVRTLTEAGRLIGEGVTDFISLSRPLLCEPDLIARWRNGDRTASRCRSCNECFYRGLGGEAVACRRRLPAAARHPLASG